MFATLHVTAKAQLVNDTLGKIMVPPKENDYSPAPELKDMEYYSPTDKYLNIAVLKKRNKLQENSKNSNIIND